MELKEIERAMRIREAAHERALEDGAYIVVRLDGRGFSALSRTLSLEKPFDHGFRDHMVATACHLMGCGFRTAYGYTQSDEISVVLDRNHDAFGRRLQKTVSVLAGEASAALSLALSTQAVFDARVLVLDAIDEVVAYLRWRQGDARRNARVGYGYWLLRVQGANARQATRTLHRLGAREQEQLLRERGGIELGEVPAWQLGGIGLWHESFERLGTDPRTGESVVAVRRRIRVEEALPTGTAYGQWIRGIVAAEGASGD